MPPATLDVPGTFGRVVSCGEVARSDVKALWAEIGKDASGSVEQMADCILEWMQAGEKCEGGKWVIMLMHSWAAALPLEPPKAREDAEHAVSCLLTRLAGWASHEGKHSRHRCMEAILAVLQGFPQAAGLEDDVREELVAELLVHVADSCANVRESVARSLVKLGIVEERDDVADVEPFRTLLAALRCEASQEVRTALVSRLLLDDSTLPRLLRHAGERADKVAAEVYIRAAKQLALRPEGAAEGRLVATPSQRRELLWRGLQEQRPTVAAAATTLLAAWLGECGGCPIALVEALEPQTNADLCQLVLDKLEEAGLWEPRAWLKAEAEGGRSPAGLHAAASAAGAGPVMSAGVWAAALDPSRAFVWAHACRAVEALAAGRGRAAAKRTGGAAAEVEASAGAQAEEALELFLPSAPDMVELCLHAARAGSALRYSAAQLLELACLSHLNWVDACSRAAAERVLRSLLAETCSGADTSVGGEWEAAVLRLARAALGPGPELVGAVLPAVQRLTEEQLPAAGSAEPAPPGPLLQALLLLQRLMVEAGPKAPPSARATPTTATATAAQDQDQGGAGGPGEGAGWSLAEAVEHLEKAAAGHPSTSVRATALRCRVLLCLREGGSQHLRRAAAALAPLLPAPPRPDGPNATHGPTAAAPAPVPLLLQRAALQGAVDLAMVWGAERVSDEVQAAAAEAAATSARAARVEAAAAGLRALGLEPRPADVEAAADAEEQEEREAGGGAAGTQAPPPVTPPLRLVPLLVHLMEGALRKGAGCDLAADPASGLAADALAGACSLLAGWAMQRRVAARLRRSAVVPMQAPQAEELLSLLLLARHSPALAPALEGADEGVADVGGRQGDQGAAAAAEAVQGLATHLRGFFSNFKASASVPGPEGSSLCRLLADACLGAARRALEFGGKGAAAAALLETTAEELAAVALAAAEQEAKDSGDADAGADEDSDGKGDDEEAGDGEAAGPEPGQGQGAPAEGEGGCGAESACAAVARLCELILEEVARLACPGSGGLCLDKMTIKGYAAALCKVLPLLLRGTGLGPTAPGARARRGSPAARACAARAARLAFLGRRALQCAAGDLRVLTPLPRQGAGGAGGGEAEGGLPAVAPMGEAGSGVVGAAGVKTLKEFVKATEAARDAAQRDAAGPLSAEQEEAMVQALMQRLAALPRPGAPQPAASKPSARRTSSRASGASASTARGRAPAGGARRTRAPACGGGGRARRSAADPSASEAEDDPAGAAGSGSDSDDAAELGDGGSSSRAKRVLRAGRKALAARDAKAVAEASQVQSQAAAPGGRRSSRAAAAKAAQRIDAMKEAA